MPSPPASRTRRRLAPLLVLLALACAVSAVVSVAFGSERIPVGEVVDVLSRRLGLGGGGQSGPADVIVWDLRVPRALLALIVGAGLAIAGAGMQTMVRNPLADPYLLGISAGASVGATAVLTFGVLATLGVHALSLGALLGALGAAVLVYAVTLAQGGLTPLRLVLAGVVMASALSAVASFLVFLSSESRSAEAVMFWMLGSVAGATWERLLLAALATLVVGGGMLAVHGWMDALAAGPDAAASLGVHVGRLRTALFVGLGALVGVLVAVSGGIGFVGLIVPHAARMLVGAQHRSMLPVAALAGALFLLWVDVLARVIVAPQEIPLGVVTGIIGAPLFLALMGRRTYQFGGAS